MKRNQLLISIVIVSLSIGCGSMPTAPSVARLPFRGVLALTGQSNTVILAPHLQQLTPVVGAWEGGQSISRWGPNDALWIQLVAALHQSPLALIYQQGESDCDGLASAVADYDAAFTELMNRIRATAHQPNLFIAVITVTPLDSCRSIRAIQEAWVKHDGHAMLISADDIERINMPSNVHLTETGAEILATRIYDALAKEIGRTR